MPRTVITRQRSAPPLTEVEFWIAHRRASQAAIAWRAAGAVLLGLSTGLAAAWVWSLVEIYENFF